MIKSVNASVFGVIRGIKRVVLNGVDSDTIGATKSLIK